MGLRIDPHRTGPILGLPALERLDDLDWLGAFRPLDASQHQARHAIGRHGSMGGRPNFFSWASVNLADTGFGFV